MPLSQNLAVISNIYLLLSVGSELVQYAKGRFALRAGSRTPKLAVAQSRPTCPQTVKPSAQTLPNLP